MAVLRVIDLVLGGVLMTKNVLLTAAVGLATLGAGWSIGRITGKRESVDPDSTDLARHVSQKIESLESEKSNLSLRVRKLEQRNGELSRELESRARVIADLRSKMAAQHDDEQTEEQPAVAANETYNDQLLATPIEEMTSEEMKGRRQDPFVDKYFQEMRKTPSSHSNVLAGKFEKEAGITLGGTDRIILQQILDSYLATKEAAEATSRALRGELAMVRMQEGDYLAKDDLDEHGQAPRPTDGKKYRSLSLHGLGDDTVHMWWSREDHPELYRRSFLVDYITVLMLEDVDEFFSERATSITTDQR